MRTTTVTRPVTSAARLAAVPALSRALAAHHIQLDAPALAAIVDDVARVFDSTDQAALPAPRKLGARFDAGWTPYDEMRLVEDQQIDDFATWWETTFGGGDQSCGGEAA